MSLIHFTTAFVLALGLTGCQKRQRVQEKPHPEAIIYAVPDGYAGWLSISYGVTEAPALPNQGGNSVAVFPESGVIETSTPLPRPPSKIDVYLYYNSTKSWPIHYEKEYGGGITEKDTSTQVAVYNFWISRNTQKDFPIYVKDRVIQPGHFPNYAPPI